MGIVRVSRWHTEGIAKFEACRQNGLTSAHGMTMIADYVNTLTSQRMHVLAQGGNGVVGVAVPNTGQQGVIRFHTSPNCKSVRSLAVAGRSGSATTLGTYNYNLFDSAGAFIAAQPTVHVGGSTGGTTGPQDLSVYSLRVVDASGADLAPDTTYEMRLTGGTVGVALAYFIVFEVPADQVDTSTDLAISPDVFQVGAPILDRDIAKTGNSLWTLYSRGGVSQGNYCDLNDTPITSVGSTWTNVMDGTTTGFSSNAAGLMTIPYRKNRFGSTTVDVVFWTLSTSQSASTGQVRFSNSAGTLATITGIPASLGPTGMQMQTIAGTLDATISTSDLVVIEQRNTTAGEFISTIACGIYELI